MTTPKRLFLILAWLTLFSLVAGPAAAAVPAAPPLARLALPDDPGAAARALVAQIYGPDELQAQAAVSELLRLAGIPLVSADGPVVALPDDLALEDAALYAELIPDLTRAVRSGDAYTPAQLAELLAEIGVSDGPMPAATLVAGLGQWGKADGSPRESQIAGAAVRALAGRRLQVLYLGADLTTLEFDPLQTLLIVAHATSRARPVAPPPSASLWERVLGVGVAYAQDKGPCDDLEQALSQGNQVEDTVRTVVKDKITDSWKEFALDEAGRKVLDKGLAVYDKGSAVVNILLLMMGARIDVSDNLGGVTHFKHAEGERDKHVKLTARATFDSNIAKKKVACYKLAGISVPPPGPLQGFKVRWSLDQEIGRGYQGKYLAVVSADSSKLDACGTCGEVTGADGRSTLELYPPVEKNPGVGEEKFGTVRVKASLDKEDFPFKLSDLLGLKNPAGFAIGKTWDLAVSAISRAGLPSQVRPIKVGYHGTDIFVAKGKTTLWLFYITAPVELDIYTCEGLEGVWKGRGGLGGDSKTFLGGMTESLFKVNIPEGVAYIQDIRFTPVAGIEDSVFDITPELKMTGHLRIDQALLNANRAKALGDRVGIPAGEVEVMINGQPLGLVAFMGSTVYPVYRVYEDPRCPPGDYYFENYP